MSVAGIHHGHAESGATPNSLNLKPTLLVLAIAQALALQAAQAASIEVTSNLDDGTDCTLRDAIDTVNAGVDQNNGCIITGTLGTDDAISFGAGVAGSTIVTNGVLTIARSVSINSGGAPTTIDANGVGRVMSMSPSSTVELDQLTLSGGYSPVSGGGIYGDTGSIITLTNSTVSGNTAGCGGGISGTEGASFMLTNSTVSGNTAGRGSGGIAAGIGVSVKLSNSTVSDNIGDGISAYRYGYSSVRLTNSTVSGNSGSGISASDASVMVTNSSVSGNTGRGIVASGTKLTVTNSTVSDNTDGGIASSNLTLMNSMITGNSTDFDGGGIRFGNYMGGGTLINSTISDNTCWK